MDECGNDFGALDQLIPMHVVVDRTGQMLHFGPTFRKLVRSDAKAGRFEEWFRIVKPMDDSGQRTIPDLIGRPLVLELLLAERVSFNAQCVEMGGNFVFALSFGFAVAKAVQRFKLTDEDFAPTDQTIGMLYLSEAYALSLGEFRNLSLRQEGAKRLAEIEAHTDPLTGLFNRRGLNAALREIRQSGQEFAIMQLDLDHFKAVNDGLGHAAGDGVLMRVAEILTVETRKNDLVSRNGGDEFTIVLTDVSD